MSCHNLCCVGWSRGPRQVFEAEPCVRGSERRRTEEEVRYVRRGWAEGGRTIREGVPELEILPTGLRSVGRNYHGPCGLRPGKNLTGVAVQFATQDQKCYTNSNCIAIFHIKICYYVLLFSYQLLQSWKFLLCMLKVNCSLFRTPPFYMFYVFQYFKTTHHWRLPYISIIKICLFFRLTSI